MPEPEINTIRRRKGQEISRALATNRHMPYTGGSLTNVSPSGLRFEILGPMGYLDSLNSGWPLAVGSWPNLPAMRSRLTAIGYPPTAIAETFKHLTVIFICNPTREGDLK